MLPLAPYQDPDVEIKLTLMMDNQPSLVFQKHKDKTLQKHLLNERAKARAMVRNYLVKGMAEDIAEELVMNFLTPAESIHEEIVNPISDKLQLEIMEKMTMVEVKT